MPAGLRIEYADGGRPFEITAGMKGLKYVGSFSNGGAATINLPELNPAFPTFLTPYETFRFVGSWVNGQIKYLTGFSVSGRSITQNYGGNNSGGGAFPASVWQIDQTTPKSGLFIADSSDFTSFGNNLALGFCVFKGVVTINGSWTPPIPAGATGVTVFVKFDAGNRTLHYNGSAITCWVNDVAESVSASVTAKVVIFAAGIEPTPQQGGLNMWNAAGRCTFSSAYRPFITYGATVQIGQGWSGVGDGMVQLCGSGGFRYSSDSRRQAWTKALGLTMSGGSVALGKAYTINTDTGWNGETATIYYSAFVTVPIIPDIYV